LVLRQVCSSVLTGVLRGYGETVFADRVGWSLLASNPRSWLRYGAFIRSVDLQALLTLMRPWSASFCDTIDTTIEPVLRGMDELLSLGDEENFCLPVVSEYDPIQHRLEAALQLPKWARSKRFLEVWCYMDAAGVNHRVFDDASSSDIDLVALPLTRLLH